MKMVLLQLGIGLSIVVGGFYSYLESQNVLTTLKMELPKREQEIRRLQEELCQLSYQIEHFESPSHLIELAHRPEFSHLKHPVLREILTVHPVYAANE